MGNEQSKQNVWAEEMVLATQAQWPKFNSRNPHKEPDSVAYVYNPSTFVMGCEAETGQSPRNLKVS